MQLKKTDAAVRSYKKYLEKNQRQRIGEIHRRPGPGPEELSRSGQIPRHGRAAPDARTPAFPDMYGKACYQARDDGKRFRFTNSFPLAHAAERRSVQYAVRTDAPQRHQGRGARVSQEIRRAETRRRSGAADARRLAVRKERPRRRARRLPSACQGRFDRQGVLSNGMPTW